MRLHRLGFYVLLIWAPFPLGSNRALFWGINGLVSALVLAGFILSEAKIKEFSRFDWRLPLVAVIGFLAIDLWIVIQAAPWTPKALHHPLWFSDSLLVNARSAISIDPSQTWQTLGWWSALSIFIVAIRLGTQERSAWFLLNLILITCVILAAFGLAVQHLGLDTVGLLPKVHYQGWLTATFINRNSAAMFFGMGMIIALALANRAFAETRCSTVFDVADVLISKGGLYALAAAGLFGTLLLTGSRAGIAASIVGASVVLLLPTIRGNKPSKFGFSLVTCVIIASMLLAWHVLQGRVDAADSTEVRLSLYREALSAISDRPILGHGAGAYSSIQPIYHSSSTPSDLIWDHAHSTVLEVMVTVGLPVTLLGLLTLGYILSQVICRMWRRPKEATSSLAVTGASIAVGLHACVDFSLEIQSIALYTASLIGLGIGEAMRLSRSETVRATAGFQLASRTPAYSNVK